MTGIQRRRGDRSSDKEAGFERILRVDEELVLAGDELLGWLFPDSLQRRVAIGACLLAIPIGLLIDRTRARNAQYHSAAVVWKQRRLAFAFRPAGATNLKMRL